MVYNEILSSMPSNGFGSPISPPDVFREVPSPSQYSDPSSSPPSMHSPPHNYASDGGDKIENMLKEEPLSPYSSFGTTTTNLMSNSPAMQCHSQQMFSMQEKSCHQTPQNQQQYQHQQQHFIQRNGNMKQIQQQVPFSGMPLQQTQMIQAKNEQQVQYSQETSMNLTDYDLQQLLLNNTELGNAVDGLMPPPPQEDMMFNTTNNETSQFQHSQIVRSFGGNVSQQQSFNNMSQQQQLQSTVLQQQQSQMMLSNQMQHVNGGEAFSNAAVAQNQRTQLNNESHHQAAQQQTTPPAITNVSTVPNISSEQAVSSATNLSFESLIETSDIKIENDSDSPNNLIYHIVDTILKNIIKDAGISPIPREWSPSDVRLWLKIAAKTCSNMVIPDLGPNFNVNGAMLVSVSATEFSNIIGSGEYDFLRDLLSLQDNKHPKSHLISQTAVASEPMKQVKLETVQKQEPVQVKQEVISHQMLPTPVVTHNQSQTLQLQQQSSVPQLSHFKSGQNQLSGEMQLSHNQQLPTNTIDQQSEQQKHFRNYHQQLQQQGAKIEHLGQQTLNGSPSLPRYQLSSNVHQFNQTSFGQKVVSLHQQNMLNNHRDTSMTNNQGSRPMLQINPGSTLLSPAASPSSTNPDSPIDSQLAMHQTLLSSPKSNPVPLQEGANGYIDDSGTDISVFLQQTSHQHPVTLDHHDEAMETDDDSDESPPPPSTTTTPTTTTTTTPTPSSNSGSSPSGRTHIQLWQFLKELLDDNKKYGACIRWVDRQEAIFKIEDSVKVAFLWGQRKNRPQMNYDKLSRSIRQYYNKSIMKKTERSQRLVYQFCKPYGQ